MSEWIKLPPIKGSIACLTCGCGVHETLSLDRVIAVGFGSANVTKDGECVYAEPQGDAPDDAYWDVAKAESEASQDPDHDWRISFFAPLWEGTYQRQGQNHWVLVIKGEGFA